MNIADPIVNNTINNTINITIRVPTPYEVSCCGKKWKITSHYRHCVAMFEQFYIYLLTFLETDISYSKWRDCEKYFDQLISDYIPYVQKHYQKNMRYYQKISYYYKTSKNFLQILRIKSYKNLPYSYSHSSHSSPPKKFDWI